MDPLIALLVVVMSVLAVLLVIVGVQVILILKEVRETLTHVNHTLKTTDDVVGMISRSASNFGDAVAGLRSGLKFTEVFVTWLKEQQSKHDAKELK